MNTKKAKHTPGPGVKDIIQAVSSEHLAGMLESASMELDWSDTPDQVRDELEQDAGQIIREAPEMAAKIERLEAVNKELLAALETLINLQDGIDDGGEGITAEDWGTARAAIAKAKSE